jgi:hypothetical protein
MVKGLVSIEKVKGYAGGSIATGRIFLPGQKEKCQMKRYTVVLHAGICLHRLLTCLLEIGDKLRYSY